MRNRLVNCLSAIAVVATIPAFAPMAQAAFTTAIVANSGTLQGGRDHFLDVSIEGDPLQRIRVQCVTFHELDGVTVSVGGRQVEPDIHYGFEEFTLTFDEPIRDGENMRIVMTNSRVRGSINAGIEVPYRVYGTYPSLNNLEVPLGTAIVRTPGGGQR
ncbi:MAG: hypothetical protein AAF152_08730 [Cyanobacteria bacterium P01_A01_bin.114]